MLGSNSSERSEVALIELINCLEVNKTTEDSHQDHSPIIMNFFQNEAYRYFLDSKNFSDSTTSGCFPAGLINAGSHFVKVKFIGIEGEEFFFNITASLYYINDLIKINFKKKIIFDLIAEYIDSKLYKEERDYGGQNILRSKIDWDSFAPSLEYKDFNLIISIFIKHEKNNEYFILSKVKDTNLSFFSKLWLLCSYGYFSEIPALIYASAFTIKRDVNPSLSDQINANSRADQAAVPSCGGVCSYFQEIFNNFIGK